MKNHCDLDSYDGSCSQVSEILKFKAWPKIKKKKLEIEMKNDNETISVAPPDIWVLSVNSGKHLM